MEVDGVVPEDLNLGGLVHHGAGEEGELDTGLQVNLGGAVIAGRPARGRIEGEVIIRAEDRVRGTQRQQEEEQGEHRHWESKSETGSHEIRQKKKEREREREQGKEE